MQKDLKKKKKMPNNYIWGGEIKEKTKQNKTSLSTNFPTNCPTV